MYNKQINVIDDIYEYQTLYFTEELKNSFTELTDILRSDADSILLFQRLAEERMYFGQDNYFVPTAQEPLAYALKNGKYFRYGDTLAVASITESFRRHIVFNRFNPDFALELLIPGQPSDRELFNVRKQRLSIDEYLAEADYKVPILFSKCLNGQIAIEAYRGEFLSFTEADPLRMTAFSYLEPYRGRRLRNANLFNDISNLPADYLKMVFPNSSIQGIYKKIKNNIADIIENIKEQNLISAERFGKKRLFGLHLNNFRLATNGKIYFLDFENFSLATSAADYEEDAPPLGLIGFELEKIRKQITESY